MESAQVIPLFHQLHNICLDISVSNILVFLYPYFELLIRRVYLTVPHFSPLNIQFNSELPDHKVGFYVQPNILFCWRVCHLLLQHLHTVLFDIL